MSFGRPPTFSDFKVSPPERGSFPLDHEGECKSVMQEYMACIKANRNDNGKCRHLSRAYLQCRMDKGLMEHDNMDNLGFKDVETESSNAAAKRAASQGRGAVTGMPSYAGDSHGADGAVQSSKVAGSPAAGASSGTPGAKGVASKQAQSYAGDSSGRSGAGRLV